MTRAARLETPVLDTRTYKLVARGRVHAREGIGIPQQCVFNTRSSDRPDPIGLQGSGHLDRWSESSSSDLEALDGTPIVDVKPVLNRTGAK